jgi:hypothetical protein
MATASCGPNGCQGHGAPTLNNIAKQREQAGQLVKEVLADLERQGVKCNGGGLGSETADALNAALTHLAAGRYQDAHTAISQVIDAHSGRPGVTDTAEDTGSTSDYTNPEPAEKWSSFVIPKQYRRL